MICSRLLFDQGNKEKHNVFCGKNPIDKVKVGYFKQLQIKKKVLDTYLVEIYGMLSLKQ